MEPSSATGSVVACEAALRELQSDDRLPSGTYLIGATSDAATLPWEQLVASLRDAIDTATKAAA